MRCQFCTSGEAVYTCPRCNALYCSPTCYRAPRHARCAGAFQRATATALESRLASGAGEGKSQSSHLQLAQFQALLENTQVSASRGEADIDDDHHSRGGKHGSIPTQMFNDSNEERSDDEDNVDGMDEYIELDGNLVPCSQPLAMLSLLPLEERINVLVSLDPHSKSEFVFDCFVPWFRSDNTNQSNSGTAASKLEVGETQNARLERLFSVFDSKHAGPNATGERPSENNDELVNVSLDPPKSPEAVFTLLEIKAQRTPNRMALYPLAPILLLYSYYDRLKSASPFLFKESALIDPESEVSGVNQAGTNMETLNIFVKLLSYVFHFKPKEFIFSELNRKVGLIPTFKAIQSEAWKIGQEVTNQRCNLICNVEELLVELKIRLLEGTIVNVETDQHFILPLPVSLSQYLTLLGDTKVLLSSERQTILTALYDIYDSVLLYKSMVPADPENFSPSEISNVLRRMKFMIAICNPSSEALENLDFEYTSNTVQSLARDVKLDVDFQAKTQALLQSQSQMNVNNMKTLITEI